ncbi:hypothetical protein PLESTM_001532600 [Pleodorina starrii]|nr:hypothetical protein PLESTM_001532600 [Pleodorina starrii]
MYEALSHAVACRIIEIDPARPVQALDANALTGPLPGMWAGMRSLRELRLRNNSLSGGCLPASWGGGLASLQDIDLSLNPQLDLSSNSIFGTLPVEWSVLADASSTGGFASSSDGGGLPQLRLLDLSSNSLQGTMPPSWSQLKFLQHLSLHSNQLSGTVPEAYGALRNLAGLRLAGNPALCGPLPSVMLNGPVVSLAVGGSSSGGAAVDANGTSSTSGAGVSGPGTASEGAALAAAINGTALLRSCPWARTAGLLQGFRRALTDPRGALANWVDGTDPCGAAGSWAGVVCDAAGGVVVGLDLQGMGLAGLPPAALALLGNNLQQINLNANSFTGTLPDSWSLLGGLKTLSIAHNYIGGSLPSAWSALHALRYLDLSYNALRGPLPAAWADGMASIQQIHVDGNSLNGTLPAAWAGSGSSGLAALRYLSADGNSISGTLPAAWSRLGELRELSLKDNLLAGPVPPSWAEGMTSLRYLGLSSNKAVCGRVPFRLDASTGSGSADTNASAPAADSSYTASSPASRPPASAAISLDVSASAAAAAAAAAAVATDAAAAPAEVRLEAESTQLGAACPDSAANGQGVSAASVQVWATAAASSVGTLMVVGLVAAAAHAAKRFRQGPQAAGGPAAGRPTPVVGVTLAAARSVNGSAAPSPRARPTTPRPSSPGGPMGQPFHPGSSPSRLQATTYADSGAGPQSPMSPSYMATSAPSAAAAAAAGGAAFAGALSPRASSQTSVRQSPYSQPPSPGPLGEVPYPPSPGRRMAMGGAPPSSPFATYTSPMPSPSPAGTPGRNTCAMERIGSSGATPGARTASVARLVSSLLGRLSGGGGGDGGGDGGADTATASQAASPRRNPQSLVDDNMAATAELYQAMSEAMAASEQWGGDSEAGTAAATEEPGSRPRSPRFTAATGNLLYEQHLATTDMPPSPAARRAPPLPPLPVAVRGSPARTPAGGGSAAAAAAAVSPPSSQRSRGPQPSTKLRASPGLSDGESPSTDLSAAGPCSPRGPPAAHVTASSSPVPFKPLVEKDEDILAAGAAQAQALALALAQAASPQRQSRQLVAAPTFMMRRVESDGRLADGEGGDKEVESEEKNGGASEARAAPVRCHPELEQ